MFNFFRRNKNAANAVTAASGQLPVSVDMHSHILPGIDDGAPDLETALQLVKGLYGLGVRKFIATPHIIGDLYRNSDETIEPALEKLRQACVTEALPVEINAAAEYMLDDYFMQLLQSGIPLRTLQHKLLLTELPYIAEPVNLQEMLFHIITAGYQPVLAHPERYLYFHQNMDMYWNLKEQGFILQVNMLSLTGYYGKNVTKAARFILEQELAGFAGTDLHHTRHLKAFQLAENQKLFQKYINNSVLLNKELIA